MSELFELTTQELHHRIAARDVSVSEVVRAFVERATSSERKLRAWNLLFEDDALAQAESLDREIAAGRPVGPLTGIPVAVKDNICLAGRITSAGSRILAGYVPPYDATAVARLRDAGVVFLGKTNLDEFGMGSSTENSAFGPTTNPWDETRSPGGSSGGSAAAVAGACVPLALGSDTGGSIRQPAAFCGTVGIKPTYGRVSRFGLIAFASSLDQIGTLAGSVRDAALGLQVVAGADPRDATCAADPVPDWVGHLDRAEDPRGVRIGVPENWFGEGLDPEVSGVVRAAAEGLTREGAELVSLDLPVSERSVPVYYLVATAEASANLARYDGVRYGHRSEEASDLADLYVRSRTEGFGPEVKRRIMLGTYALSAGYYEAHYLKAQQVRTLIRQELLEALSRVDVILAPATPSPAFELGEKTDDPLAMYLSDVYTTPASLAGLPAASVPGGRTDSGLPIGVQLIGRPFEEASILAAARWIERSREGDA